MASEVLERAIAAVDAAEFGEWQPAEGECPGLCGRKADTNYAGYCRACYRRDRLSGILPVKYLPARPLAKFIDDIVERRRKWERLRATPADSPLAAEVCGDLGVDIRNVYAWRVGERKSVEITTAERVILRAGVDWEDVWAPAEFPELWGPEITA